MGLPEILTVVHVGLFILQITYTYMPACTIDQTRIRVDSHKFLRFGNNNLDQLPSKGSQSCSFKGLPKKTTQAAGALQESSDWSHGPTLGLSTTSLKGSEKDEGAGSPSKVEETALPGLRVVLNPGRCSRVQAHSVHQRLISMIRARVWVHR